MCRLCGKRHAESPRFARTPRDTRSRSGAPTHIRYRWLKSLRAAINAVFGTETPGTAKFRQVASCLRTSNIVDNPHSGVSQPYALGLSLAFAYAARRSAEAFFRNGKLVPQDHGEHPMNTG